VLDTRSPDQLAENAVTQEAPKRRATAETMASRQREISVSEFFTKNRHLLGFDNPAKALLTTVKEAVDNSLDACEEAGILPEILVEITEVAPAASANQPSRFRVAIEDNGPGILKPQIPKVFAKLLYGSKFHRLKQSRGQQGIGISAAGLYGQLTTGKPVVITSKTGKGRPAFKIDLRIDTKRNQPDVVSEDTAEWHKEHGTRVEIELVAAYRGGRTGVQEYLEQTVVANPHLSLTWVSPKGERFEFPRVTNELPREAQEI
jgi:DNA topoisomerase-6 subunit B